MRQGGRLEGPLRRRGGPAQRLRVNCSSPVARSDMSSTHWHWGFVTRHVTCRVRAHGTTITYHGVEYVEYVEYPSALPCLRPVGSLAMLRLNGMGWDGMGCWDSNV
jgi:hypothetical protein